MKADQLPSGKWRCRVYLGEEITYLPDGTKKATKKFKTFISEGKTQKDKRKVIAEASAFAVDRKQAKTIQMTFGMALDKYIADREATLSSTTINEYKRIRKREMQELMGTRLDRVDQDLIQREIDRAFADHSSHTVRNWHGLVSPVLKEFRPDLVLHTNLPPKDVPDDYIPNESDIKKLLEIVKDTPFEIPVMLAAFGPLRRGEVCGLKKEHIVGNRVHVCENMVKKSGAGWVIKPPKTKAGDRYIEFPDFVAEKWKDIPSGYLVTAFNPDNITNQFGRLLKKNGIVDENGSPLYHFHSLRHFCASWLHALGVPNAYIMARGGWENENVLNKIYRHVLDQEEKKNSDKINKAIGESFFGQKKATPKRKVVTRVVKTKKDA